MMKEGGLGRAASVVAFFTLVSRILGLVRDMVIARFFGSGTAADAFFVAFRIPNLLRRLFAEGSLTIAFIPVFTEYLARKGKREAMELAAVVMTLLSVALALVTVLGILLSPWIVRLQAFGFGAAGYKYELTVLLTRIMFPYIMLVSLVALCMGILNSLRHFAAPAAAPILLNIAIIAGAYVFSPFFSEPVIGLSVAVLVGGAAQLLLQLPWLLKEGFTFKPRWQPGHAAVLRIGALMGPAVYGSAVYQVNQFVGTLLASLLAEGSVSWLYYADRLIQFPLGVFAIAVSTAALPSLASHAAQRDLEHFRSTLSQALRLVFFITLPSMAGLMVLGRPLIEIFFQRGAFGVHSTVMTAQALFFYALGLWAYSGIRVLVAAFYAVQDTKTPVKIATAALFINITLSIAFMAPLKHGGLALALSLASGIQFLLLGYFLRERIGQSELKAIGSSIAKASCASFVMALCLWVLDAVLPPAVGLRGVLRLGGLVTAGVIMYFAAAWAVRCSELASAGRIVASLGKRLAGKR